MATGGSLIGALRVTLGLDSARFEEGLRRARGSANRDATAIQKQLTAIKTGFNALIGAGIGTALIAAGKRALEYASSLGEVAQQLGVTTSELQEYRYAASQAGISSDEMDNALGKLTKTMGGALAGGKAQVASFRELGVALKDANGRVYTAGELIPKLADAFAKIKDPASRARLETELFGKAGQKLDTLLAGGSKAVNELRDAAHKLGIVLSDEQIQKADETADKLAAVKQVLESRIAGIVSDNADAILKIGDALGYAAGQVGQFFKNMQGVERLKRDEGWASGFFASWGDQATAADPKKYVKKRLTDLQGATRDRKMAEASGGGKDYFGFQSKAVKDARARESEALRLLNAARKDPAFLAALASERAPKKGGGVIGDGDLPTASGGKPKKPKGGGKDKSADYLERFNSELANLADQQLSLQMDITTDVRERARLEHLRIENEQAAYNFDVENRVKSGELTAAQAEQLRLQHAANAQKQHTLVNWQLDDDLTEQELDLKRAGIDAENTILNAQLDAARTQEDRRRIQLRILENEMALERAALEAIKAKHKSTDVEYQIADSKLEQLGREQADRAGAIRRDTMGPLEQWADNATKSAGEMREAFEGITVNALNNSLDMAAENVLKLKGVAGQLFNQLIADVIRLNLQSALTGGGGGILGSLGKMLGLGASLAGGSAPSDFSFGGPSGASILEGWDTSLPGLATGGSFMAGGRPGTDRNVLSIGGIPKVRVSADERISVQRAGQDNDRPIVIQMYSEEGPALVPRVSAISEGTTVQNMTRSAAYGARAARQRL